MKSSLHLKEKDLKDLKIRLLELMLYREAGGSGYDLAVSKIAESCPEFYTRILQNLEGIRDS